MRIAFVGQKGITIGLGGGGVERHVSELAPRLVALGHDVIVFARRKYCSPDCEKEFSGVQMVYLPTIYTKHLEAIVHTFLATIYCLFHKLDVIHFQGVGPALLSWVPRLFRPRMTVVVTFHAQDRYHLKWGSFARFVLHIGEWMACRAPHATIVVSHGMQVLVRREYGAHASLIPNGANIKSVYTTRELGVLGLRPKEYILTVGRLLPVKGLHLLIPAYRRTDTKKPLIVVGVPAEKGYLEHLKMLAKGDSRIRFVGYRTGKALDELFAHAYLFCQPSISEGLPLTVLEAMSFGTPVLVSDIPGNLEAMHRSGFTFESENIDDLYSQLQHLTLNKEDVCATGLSGKRVVESFFNWDKIAERTERVYQLTRRQHVR